MKNVGRLFTSNGNAWMIISITNGMVLTRYGYFPVWQDVTFSAESGIKNLKSWAKETV